MKEASREFQTLFSVGVVGALSDGQLLERFAVRREGAAFEALVHRHGPMVWGVCRRILRDTHDAEDAFQATFLVLARKAPAVAHREMVANWLYAVAYKTAVRAEALARRRRAREHPMAEMPEPQPEPRPGTDDGTDELLPLLDRELSGLPEKYRTPILLCDLEGMTHKEAARRLGCPIGTVSGRLSRARAMLAKRLARRGVALAVGAGAVLSGDARATEVPRRLLEATVRIGMRYRTGAAAAGPVSASVSGLVTGGMKQMFLAKLRLATLAMLAVVGVAASLSASIPRGAAADGPSPASVPSAVDAPTEHLGRQRDSEREAIRRLIGAWEVVKCWNDDAEAPVPFDYHRWHFSDEAVRMEWKEPGEEAREANIGSRLRFSINPTREPRELTVYGETMLMQLIYQLNEDTLKLCFYGRSEVERPQGFTTKTTRKNGSTLIVWLLKRRDEQP